MGISGDIINGIRNRLFPTRPSGVNPEIAVVHPDLMRKGGAEAVCMNILEALQYTYDVTLLTLVHPKLDELNEFYGTSVDQISVEQFEPTAVSLLQWLSKPLRFDLKLDGLQWALLDRHARNVQDTYDLVISTRDEISFRNRALQYIHMPTRAAIIENGRQSLPGYAGHTSLIYRLYDIVRFRLAGYEPDLVKKDRLLTNSEWTAGMIEQVYGADSKVIYPPIDKREFSSIDWGRRETGFVMIGRLSPEKRVLEALEIIDALHDFDADIHIHVVGSAVNPEYAAEVERMASTRKYVHLEGECSRERLVELIQRHRYGLHSKKFEHFGMTVAEFAVGGAIPFVHNSGGQTDIVLDDDRLTYDDAEAAIRKAKTVIGNEGLQQEITNMLSDSTDRFSKQTFQQRLREVVINELEHTNE